MLAPLLNPKMSAFSDAQAVFASTIASISRPLHLFIARSVRVAERPR